MTPGLALLLALVAVLYVTFGWVLPVLILVLALALVLAT